MNQAWHPMVLAEKTMSDNGDINVVKEQPGLCEGPKNSLLYLIRKTKITIFFFFLGMGTLLMVMQLVDMAKQIRIF